MVFGAGGKRHPAIRPVAVAAFANEPSVRRHTGILPGNWPSDHKGNARGTRAVPAVSEQEIRKWGNHLARPGVFGPLAVGASALSTLHGAVSQTAVNQYPDWRKNSSKKVVGCCSPANIAN